MIQQPSHILQTLEVDFDRILCDILDKYHSFPRLTLLLGSLLQSSINTRKLPLFPPGMVASLYLVRQRGEGHVLDDTGFSGIHGINSCNGGTPEFLTYLAQLLENSERSGPRVFDQQRYAAAAKECLQLFLCSYHHFSKGVGHRDRALRRNKPAAWMARMGLRNRSRIQKGRHHFKVLLKASMYIIQDPSFPEDSPQHEYYRSLSYRWALDLLPSFLENSAISLELAEVLRRRTFTTMAQQFPRRKRLAKDAITKYLLQVESAVGNS